MLDFIPRKLKDLILSPFKTVYEIRLRSGLNATVIGDDGRSVKKQTVNYAVSREEIESAVLALTDFSIFSKEESLKRGVITSACGERVGICGEFVYSDGKIIGVKNFTSLCIRFPHDVKGCSQAFTYKISSPQSVLVISPPFQGKTTFIRDLGRAYSDKFNSNVLFVDEKDELSCGGSFHLGNNSDVIRYSSKNFGFTNGIRHLNPDVIVCDELIDEDDYKGVEFASLSGVKVIATVHSDSIENLLKKPYISEVFKNGVFKYAILLNKFEIRKIYEVSDWEKLL